ncbi:MAG: hypothetical protein ABGY29_04025, partial [bacterium]
MSTKPNFESREMATVGVVAPVRVEPEADEDDAYNLAGIDHQWVRENTVSNSAKNGKKKAHRKWAASLKLKPGVTLYKIPVKRGSSQVVQKKPINLFCACCVKEGKELSECAYYDKACDPANMWNQHVRLFHPAIFNEHTPHLNGSRKEVVVSNRTDPSAFHFVKKFDPAHTRRIHAMIARWVSASSRSLALVTDPGFKDLLIELSDGRYTGPKAEELWAHIYEDTAIIRAKIKALLAKAIAFHAGGPFLTIYFDGWTDTMTTVRG